MAFSYKPLWRLMFEKDLNKNYLREELKFSPTTVAKMGKDEYVSLEIIDKLCSHFNVEPGDIIQHKKGAESNGGN
ncbi:helix-turn-helix domain-containing protein [Paenibacillus glycanilyticus]|uniref:helix-turn-helix domain-containing protein n=1 Tax=Paenibacillus glycanilyticus TaxID=126569 RepID=UPI001910D6DB|nr:helix-turn-helix domain-containing protein [Paenibacillus glycanilyticus]